MLDWGNISLMNKMYAVPLARFCEIAKIPISDLRRLYMIPIGRKDYEAYFEVTDMIDHIRKNEEQIEMKLDIYLL